MIVVTEVESIHGAAGQQRLIFYRCQDHLGEWHSFGPIRTNDDAFDVEAYKATVAIEVAESLADQEFEEALNS
jgi:hypothetical protein